ncbi:MAG: hypothetical protein HUJ76_12280, partial [Parasporobacterium sp.]|nr:hypothetical protein [Parasporobacterium sp.]
MEENKMYKIKNRSAGVVVYSVPELRIRREIRPGQIIDVSYDELEKLSFIPGGKSLMKD